MFKGSEEAITEIIRRKKRTFSAEVIPPRNGTETEAILRQIQVLRGHEIDFISVTKGAGGSLRGGTLPIAQLIKMRYETCSLAHFTCRDYTVEEIENSLMDHYYFGIRNILALRGDPPDGQAGHFAPGPNRYTFAHQLVRQISALNRGEYLIREGFDKSTASQGYRQGQATDFCIGVACYPEDEPFEQAVEYFKVKVDAGAHFAITQMIYDPDAYSRFIEAAARVRAEIPVLPGLRIITSVATAQRMTEKFGIKIPASFIEKLGQAKSKDDARKIGLDFTHELSLRFLKAGAPGIHVFVMSDEQTAVDLVKGLRTS